MLEVRKDYVLDRYVIISTDRAKRPDQFKETLDGDKPKKQNYCEKCFFCLGNENTTPPEKGRVEKKGNWTLRWFDNKFGAARFEGQRELQTDNKYYTYSSSYGEHEVIVETNSHSKQLGDLPSAQLKELFSVFRDRINSLEAKEGIKYAILFKNHGKDGGTSLEHSHSQIMSMNRIPVEVRAKTEAAKKFEGCPYCEIVNNESQGIRKCYENEEFVAFTPYASRFNFEIWIFPKKHTRRFEDISDLGKLAEIMKKILVKLKYLNCSYNINYFHSPKEEDLHFHIQIEPRIAKWAGFEIGAGEYINTVSPEDAAKFYRGEE